MTPAVRLYFGLVLFSLAGSWATAQFHLNPGPIPRFAAIGVLGVGVWASFAPWCARRREAVLALLMVLVVGAVAEIVGITTGFPFGRYAYTDVWFPTVMLPGDHRFPLLVPVAWGLVAGSSFLWISRTIAGPAAAVIGGLLAALLDLGMEPVMVGRLHYWQWLEAGPLPGGAPVANFFGWWGTATLAGLILGRANRAQSVGPAPAWVLLGHLLLTVGIGLIAR